MVRSVTKHSKITKERAIVSDHWIHREAGLAVMFEWQDGQWRGILDSTTVLGSITSSDGIETHIVYCEGTGFDHDTPFTLKEYIAITATKDEDGNEKINVDDATKEQIKAVMEE
jgi:hypothetical protein